MPTIVEPNIDIWEAAYSRFETSAEEQSKFVKRLVHLGVESWDRNLAGIELFCGRGNALNAWNELGFRNIEGLDISPRLLKQYRGPCKLHQADARDLPFDDNSFDFISVQGGLHHLNVDEDFSRTVVGISRVLKPGGHFLFVEPWLTPFLAFVHSCCNISLLRRSWTKLDALATMIEHERETYENWLAKPEFIRHTLNKSFKPLISETKFGKMSFLGVPLKGP